MENDMQLMCMMVKEMVLILKKKPEDRLKNGLAKDKTKAIMFIFTAKETEL
jgi:hypothetical protein